MLRLIWVFAGGTAILLVLSCCGSNASTSCLMKITDREYCEAYPEISLRYKIILASVTAWYHNYAAPVICNPWGPGIASRTQRPGHSLSAMFWPQRRPVLPWNRRAFDSMPKRAGVISHLPARIRTRLLTGLFLQCWAYIQALRQEKSISPLFHYGYKWLVHYWLTKYRSCPSPKTRLRMKFH